MAGQSREGLNRNREAGRRFELACLAALRAAGWPADRHGDKRASDIVGVGDLALEVTTAGWDKLPAKLRQAARDAAERNLPAYCVWRKRVGSADPMQGYVLLDASVWWMVWGKLDRVDQQDMAVWEAFERGRAAGLAEAREEAS